MAMPTNDDHYLALRKKAQSYLHVGDLIDHLNKKSTAYIVVIKYHDTGDRTDLAREDFVWIKASAKITVSKIKQAYLSQNAQDDIRTIELRLGLYLPADATRIDYLDHFHDRVVMLEASLPNGNTVTAQTAPGLVPSTNAPLSTTSTPMSRAHALPIPPQPSPHASKYPMPQPPRTPLQPTSNHVNAQSHISHSSGPNSGETSALGRSSGSSYIEPERKAMGQAASHPPSHGHKNMPLAHENVPPATEAPLPTPLPVQPYVNPQPREEDAASGPYGASQDSQYDDDQPQSSVYLEDLAQATSAEKLEAGVKNGVKLLDQLQQALGPAQATEDGREWLTQIEATRADAVRTRTVVGVVGNTGAGKSSVINSLLEEERLVPTNCMRACTAVVTEISYNYDPDDAAKYQAEIEFIQPDDWEKELKVLFDDVLDASGNISRDVYTGESDAGIAYAKIRAVYFKHTKEQFVESSVDELMREQHVRRVLGSTQLIKEHNCDVFYKRLQHYVDSKEKPESTKSSKKQSEEEKKNSRKREMEFWPLIKVVRIHVKAEALSTGAVLVDLPGVHDSNAARAAVAQGYMKQCTGLWIVAPITRAVDDKAAKNLLGESFRRQLKYDGTYSAVTFICSKTDDISNTEAADSLGLGDQMSVFDDELYDIDRQRRQKKKQLERLKNERSACRDTVENADEQQEKYEQLQEDLSSGQTVYAPAPKSRKRKRSASFNSDVSGSDNEEVRSPAETGSPLTEADIEDKLSELKDAKKEARRQRSELDTRIKELNLTITDLDTRADKIEAKRSAICISGRNKYSKSAIQVDFAAGIKELDQENQAEEDPDAFNPDEELRDYEEVARSLPVFCVSSRAYQKLSGRLIKDHAVKGFTDVEETEIPALQAHCKKLTEGSRQFSCRRFLNGLLQLRTSMGLWASDDGNGAKLTDEQRDTEQRFMTRKLRELERALEKCISDTLIDMKETLSENIFENFDTAINLASDAALPTSLGWGAHRNEGGLYWATYKATVRRDGVYSGAAGMRDFNAELTEPLYKHLATGWEKAFQHRLPHVLKACAKGFSKVLGSFFKDLEERARKRGGMNPRLALLQRQLTAYEAVFADLANKMVETINEAQREANREFTPVVLQAMSNAYTLCTDESGKGSFMRMKGHMSSEVAANKDVMFRRATQTVQDQLKTMCKAVEEQMAERTDQCYMAFRRDVISVLGNTNMNANAEMMPRWERNMRREVEDIVIKSEQAFQDVIEGRIEVEKVEEVQGTSSAAVEVNEGLGGFDGISSKPEDANGYKIKFEDADGNSDKLSDASVDHNHDGLGAKEPDILMADAK